MGSLRPWHIAVLVVLLILLFGAKRLPDAARSLGRSMRILKSEVKGMQEDDVQAKAEAQNGRTPLDGRPQIDHNQHTSTSAHDPAQRVHDN
ncbi:MAG TPA: Sec-independent protein translocase subunit TatA [Micromonosporaceae bacterium]|nr:Sec-independent protein translocase subunit TatA [Micromonosporaceae bacterium]